MVLDPTHSPFKGPAFFTAQDRKFFFGRSSDTRRIVDAVRTGRLSMLHAQSGAGKTSLLRASVIPALDAQGYETCYFRPGPDPARAMRCATLMRAISPPAREAAALEQAMTALQRYLADTGDQQTVEDIAEMPLRTFVNAYHQVPPNHRAHRDMVPDADEYVPECLKVAETHSLAGMSMIGRLLVSSRGPENLRYYLVRLCRLMDLPSHGLDSLDALTEISVGQIHHFLADLASRDLYDGAAQELLDTGKELSDYFLELSAQLDRDGDVLPLRHVIMIDQFEEFFTRFKDDTGFAGPRRNVQQTDFDFRIRDDFFRQINGLMQDDFRAKHEDLRVTISLRDDYVARLFGFERICGQIPLGQRNAVPLLSPEDLEDVVRGPAGLYDVTIADEVVKDLNAVLAEEGHSILPITVQIVCARLWEDLGDGSDQINRDAFERYVPQGGSTEDAIRAIIENYVGETLEKLNLLERMDALRVLASLMTLDGTREVVPYARLTERSFVNRSLRRKILNILSENSIISQEAHKGGKSVEIKHEFLLGSIHRNLRESQSRYPEWHVLQRALDNLERGVDIDDEELAAIATHSDALEPEVLQSGLAEKLFRLSALEPNVSEKQRQSWLGLWSKDMAFDPDVDPIVAVAAAAVKHPDEDDLRKLRGLSDFSSFSQLTSDSRTQLITNVVRGLPPHDAVPILKEVRRHA